MAYDFPPSPEIGQESNGHVWNGYAWVTPQGDVFVPEAPVDGKLYGRKNGGWAEASGGGGGGAATSNTRSRVINGGMQVSQDKGASATTSTGGPFYVIDEWQVLSSGVTPQALRATAPVNGYAYSQRFTVAKASLGANDVCQNFNLIEGARVSDFQWGTATAKSAVLRLDAWSQTPGLYPVVVMNAAGTHRFIKGIDLTGTPQTFIIPIPPIIDGVWPTTNVGSISIRIVTAAGTNLHGVEGWQASSTKLGLPGMVNLAADTTKYIYFTNVGLYLDGQGTGIAPAWDMPDEAQELIACQRYFQKFITTVGFGAYTTNVKQTYTMFLPITMRATPAATFATALATNANAPSGIGASIQHVQFDIVAPAAGPSSSATTLTANARM